MKRYSVEFSPRAEATLGQLLGNLLERAGTDLDEIDRCAVLLQDLRMLIEVNLSRQPKLYAPIAGSSTRRELRMAIGGGYSAAYKIEEQGGKVIVLAVRHQRQRGYARPKLPG